MLMLQLSCFEYIFRSLLVYRALITISLVWFERKTIQLLLEMTVWEFRNVQCNAARIRPADRRSQRDAGRDSAKVGQVRRPGDHGPQRPGRPGGQAPGEIPARQTPSAARRRCVREGAAA